MKSVKQKITVFVIISLAIGGFVAAQNTTEQVTCTISGKVESSGIPLPGVVMKGLPGNVITDLNGFYSAEVPRGSNGIVTPTKAGYTFRPVSIAYTEVITNLTNEDFTAERIPLTISGSVGIAGVIMQGLPGNVVTDSSGSYSFNVDYGWSGAVIPQKEGYEFNPPQKRFESVSTNFTNQNYQATPHTYTIAGSAGAPNVIMRGFPENVVTDADGYYAATVEYGWSGTVTPEKEGYTFEPASRIYTNITADRNNDFYKSEMKRHTISGIILSDKGEPMKGVELLRSNGDSIVTDEDGRYYFYQEYGWSGMFTPTQEGYTFTPKFRQYLRVTRDQTNQNYKAELQMLTISDVVEFGEGRPFAGVQVTANNGGGSAVTDSRGQYSIEVPYGWSGEITLSKPGIKLNPPSISYTNVTTDIINGIPAPSRPTMGAMGGGMLPPDPAILTQVSRIGTGRMLIVPAEDIETEDVTATREDMQVMAEILDERFREPRMIEGVFRDFGDFFGRDNRKTEAVYIQGYGVIFMMEVDYTFSTTPQTQEQAAEEKNQEIDSTWEQARARVLSPGGTRVRRDVSEREYENQMVEILKTELIRALKYAANIRNLQPDEWVILSVAGNSPQAVLPQELQELQEFFFGSQPAPSGSSSYGASGGYGGGISGYSAGYGGSSGSYSYGGGMVGGYGGGGMMGGYGSGGMMGGYGGGMMVGYGMRSPSASVLTIRVKKSDVDEFASDKLDFEKFRETVQILIY